MKRVRCPKCDNYISFDETKYTAGQKLIFQCNDCGKEFAIRIGVSKLRKLQKDDLIEVFLWDSGNKAKKGAFYVCYTHSKNRSMPKAVIGLK